MGDRVVDPLLVPLVRSRVRLLLGDDLLSPFPSRTFMPAVEVNAVPRVERAQLDELARVDVERPQQRRVARRA